MKECLAHLVGLVVGFAIGFVIGRNEGAEQETERAIKAGVAQYTVDPKTGQTQFVYLGRVEK